MVKRAREESAAWCSGNDGTGSSTSPSTERTAHTSKYTSMEPTTTSTKMRCSLPPHKPLSFPTYDEYESHYHQAHTNRCKQCKKNFPTGHFLELHIAENHDPIVASKRADGEKTYACFVEGCDKVCSEWRKRRMHLVDKHGYPKNFDFLVVNHGIDGRRSMLRRGVDAEGHRESSRERIRSGSSLSVDTNSTEATSVSEEKGPASPEKRKLDSSPIASRNRTNAAPTEDAAKVDDLTSALSALNMVPRSITFGQRKGRSGFAKS